jgi:hypothetical protein
MLLKILTALLFISVVSCKNNTTITGKSNITDTSLKILTYGLPSREGTRAMNTVAKQYGFHYYAVAGCIISKSLLDSVNRENKKVYEILEKRFGNNWRSTFAEQVDSMEQLQMNVEELVKKQDYIIAKQKELKKDGNGLDYKIQPTDKQNIFFVKAYGWGMWNGKTELLVYYTLTVDLSRKLVIKSSEDVEKLYKNS